MLKSWEIPKFSPENEKLFLEQVLWNNKNILINKKSIFFKPFYDHGIIYIHQLFDNNKHLLSWGNLQSTFHLPTHCWLKYYGILEAFPRGWKRTVNDGLIEQVFPLRPMEMKIEGTKIDVGQLNSKQLYKCFVKHIAESPTGKIKLIERFNLSESECSKVFTLPFAITTSSRLRSFQYRILPNILYLNEFLHYKAKWPIDPRFVQIKMKPTSFFVLSSGR